MMEINYEIKKSLLIQKRQEIRKNVKKGYHIEKK